MAWTSFEISLAQAPRHACDTLSRHHPGQQVEVRFKTRTQIWNPRRTVRQASSLAFQLVDPAVYRSDAPRSWFAFDERDYCSLAMHFGRVEVGFVAEDSHMVVTYTKFWMEDFRGSLLPFMRPREETGTDIFNPFRRRVLQFTVVVDTLTERGIKFRKYYSGTKENCIPAVIAVGDHFKFYFFDAVPGQLRQIGLDKIDRPIGGEFEEYDSLLRKARRAHFFA